MPAFLLEESGYKPCWKEEDKVHQTLHSLSLKQLLCWISLKVPTLDGHVLQEEKNAQALLDDEDKPDYVPQAFDSLRQVPMYSDFIKERFERCLDLYLCPRGKKTRINVDPQSLVPKLPKPQDLQPFPTTLLLRYTGHKGRVRLSDETPSCHAFPRC